MFTGAEFVAICGQIGVTHVVWVPDSTTGPWEAALESASELTLVRVCREGEAWPLAAGLHLGGQTPLVLMQCTGLFESGDALRNVLFDLQLPLLALIGVRNALVPESRDSARRFAEPVVRAWGFEPLWVRSPTDGQALVAFMQSALSGCRPAVALLAEGAG